jgi:hypothetical protein
MYKKKILKKKLKKENEKKEKQASGARAARLLRATARPIDFAATSVDSFPNSPPDPPHQPSSRPSGTPKFASAPPLHSPGSTLLRGRELRPASLPAKP